ncbi:MAG: hypothetical protein HYZ75_12180 [Elusimicrobia bacterium]|nr:hypothetical protein [Elusimicrobiota bacterium]
MRTAALLAAVAILGHGAPAYAAAESDEAAARMERQARDFLDGLLGPGRARVFVTVQGEISEVQTQSEVVTPVLKPPSLAGDKLPGYAAIADDKSEIQFVQKDVERSTRHPGLQIKRVNVTVVIDSKVTAAQENAVRRLLPDLLRLAAEREDDLTVLRADLMPAWKALAFTSEGVRLGALLAGGLFGGLLLASIVVLAGLRGVRILLRELGTIASSRFERIPQTSVQGGAASGPERPMELLGGGLPSLADLGADPSLAAGGRLPALGRRFDFLIEREPQEAARRLASENADELALLFSQISESAPDAAGRLFESLPPPLQTSVAAALARLSEADPRKVDDLEERLRARFESGIEGPRRLGALLSRVPPETREEVLGGLISGDPDAARDVESALFPFEALAGLERRDLRRLITAVPQEVWGLALRGTTADLSDKILAEFPLEVKAVVGSVLRQPQSRDKVMAARGRILAEARAMSERGLIVLGGEGAASLI